MLISTGYNKSLVNNDWNQSDYISVRTIPVSGIGRYQRVSVSADTPIILARDTDTGEQQCVWPST